MDQEQNQNEAPMQEAPVEESAPKEKSAGGVISTIIIVVIILIGAVYLFTSREPAIEMTPEEISTAPDAQVEALMEQGTSDSLTTIEEDLDATELEGLDAELDAIEAELNL